MIGRKTSCETVRAQLPGFLDGALRWREHAPVQAHLESCADCRRELETYRKLSGLMSRVEPVAPPPDLALRVRNAVSRARAELPLHRRLWNRLDLVLENMLEPIAVPATGGLVSALVVFVVVLQHLFVGIPLGAVPNDVPTNLMQPARLEALANFPLSNDELAGGGEALMVEATVNFRGEVVGYEIVAGPESRAVRRQLEQVLYFSRFRPAMIFGRPVTGGRVLLSFSEVRVRG
jgi:hypothetical protein